MGFLLNSMRNKLVLAFTTLIVLSVGVSVISVNIRLHQASENKIIEETRITANVLKEFRRTQLRYYSDATSALIGNNPQLRASLSEYNHNDDDLFGDVQLSETPEEISQKMEDIVREIALFQQSSVFIITNGAGKVLYQKGAKNLLEKDLSPLPVMQSALHGYELFTWWGKDSPVYQYLPEGTPAQEYKLVEVFLKPVVFGDDVTGVLIIGLDLTESLNQIKKITLSEIAVFQAGKLYGSSNMAYDQALEQLASRMDPEQEDAIYAFKHQDEDFLVLATHVTDGMREKIGSILIFRSKTEEMRFFTRLSDLLNVIGVLAVLTGVFFSLLISRGVTRSVKVLSEGADSVKNGNLDVHLVVESQDELGHLAQTFNAMVQGLKEKEHIKRTFKKYVSSSVVDELLKSNVTLGGEKKDVTIYFSDIVDFTSISEKLTPEQLILFLNNYLTHMTNLIEKEGGIVDKYIGDAIMAFWGAPLVVPNQARNACITALNQQARHDPLPVQQADHLAGFSTRIGIHSGEVIVGNVGSESRMDYTVIGDAVNIAARLESLNKYYGTQIIISENIFKALPIDEFLVRELDLTVLKGKSNVLRIYELLGMTQDVQSEQKELLAMFQEGLQLYRTQQFKAALDCFKNCLKRAPQDGPSHRFVEQCQNYLSHPPEPSWQGVQVMSQK
ncbi:MAG: HAMP domain-containing protein [SAR324 cluster bacterium]|nr:HAMP domain-containing protein [SAR324 cluster bacterium]